MRPIALLCLSLLVACSSSPVGTSSPAGLTVVSGADQQGVAGYPLRDPIVVRVSDAQGAPLANATLRVTTSAPLARVSADDWVTDAMGQVSFRWQRGASVDGETVTVSVADNSTVEPLTVHSMGGSRPVRAIAGGLDGYCAVTLDGQLGCWRPLAQVIFPEILAEAPTMTFAAGSDRFVDVAIGDDAYLTPISACAVRTDGGVECFNHREGLASLADIGGTHPPFTQVIANQQSTTAFFCALTADGAGWCWGANAQGQLGNGTTTPQSTPAPLATETRFRQLALGGSHACGIDYAGAAWCWGANGSGATGTGTTTGKSLSPTAVATPLRFVSIVVIADDATCAVTAGGIWYCWGNGFGSTLGENVAVPTLARIPGGSRLASADNVGIASDGAGNAVWWGDLYPTLDLTLAPNPVEIAVPIPVVQFAPAVNRMAACIDADASQRWLCVDLLWLAMSGQSGSQWDSPLVHGVP